MLARCSLVNRFGHVLYDKYVAPQEWVTDFRTKYSGIRVQDVRSGKGILLFNGYCICTCIYVQLLICSAHICIHMHTRITYVYRKLHGYNVVYKHVE